MAGKINCVQHFHQINGLLRVIHRSGFTIDRCNEIPKLQFEGIGVITRLERHCHQLATLIFEKC